MSETESTLEIISPWPPKGSTIPGMNQYPETECLPDKKQQEELSEGIW